MKPNNLFNCSGRVSKKRYDENKKECHFDVAVFVPKRVRAMNEDDNMSRDYPHFIVTGEDAASVNELISDGDRVSIIGHLEMNYNSIYLGRRMSYTDWLLRPVADQIIKDSSRDGNSVLLCGEVTRVYRNADAGKKFYIMSLKVPKGQDGEETTRVDAIYFDPRMTLEPKIGDMVQVEGVVQTKFVPIQNSDKRRKATSVVARNVMVERK